MEDAFVGIDVAFAKRKRLPVCICVKRGRRLTPIALRDKGLPEPPYGLGNKVAVLEPKRVAAYARDVRDYLNAMAEHFELRIRAIALDCPSAPCRPGMKRRAADSAMDERGISCFTTPNQTKLSEIREKVRAHFERGGKESHQPHANQLWMLPGFALFRELEKHFNPCLEVFPQATVRVIGAGGTHKSKKHGYEAQRAAAARHTGWSDAELETQLARAAWAPNHDILDAYLCAWVAALPESKREACGDPDAGDVIWVPRV